LSVPLLVSWHLAGGSACYGHDDAGGGIEDIGSDLATWWAQILNEYADSEIERRGRITVKGPKKDKEKEEPAGVDPNNEQITDQEANPTTGYLETTEIEATIPDKSWV